jgi:hypothetical protein
MEIGIVEKFGGDIHELHNKLRHDLLKSIPEKNMKQRAVVISILNLSSTALTEYTNRLFEQMNNINQD